MMRAFHPVFVPILSGLVKLVGGMCGGASAFGKLVDNPHVLIHHPSDDMLSPDMHFLAHRSIGGASEELVLTFQLKDRASGTLTDALKSLRWNLWEGADVEAALIA
jgi:hypothetical protein